MEIMKPVTFVSCEGFTQDEFVEWLDTVAPEDLDHYELLDGHIVREPPAGWPHGEIDATVAVLLGQHVRSLGIGRVFGSSQGFELPNGDTVEPDASFVSNERWAGRAESQRAFPRVVPDLVVEIVSPGSGLRDREQKKRIYEHCGVREYWLVEPASRTVKRYVAEGGAFDEGSVFGETAALESTVVPGLRVTVGELFPEP